MSITINGDGTIGGVSVGGLPDGVVDADMLAANAVTTAKINDDAVTDAKQSLSGTAKAWVNFNGTGTVAINNSFNVTSITDNGTGDYTINFTNNMSNTNYSTICSGPVIHDQGSTYGFGIKASDNDGTPSTKTTSAVRVLSRRDSDVDFKDFNVAIFSS